MGDDTGIVIVGGGGHARVVAEAIGASCVAGHVAPEPSEDALLGPWLGDDSAAAVLAERGYRFAIGIGFVDRVSCERRGRVLEAWAGSSLVSVVHSSAIVSPSASLEPGSFVAAGAVVGTSVVVGAGSIVNTGAIVDHDARIGRNTHIAPRVVLSGGVTVGSDTLVGVGATVRQDIRIGESAVVGAGAVVVADVADGSTVLGVPARSVAP